MSDERSKPRTQKVPAAALNFTVGDLELGDNGDGAKTAPFRMVARSGEPIDHWYWGKVAHDLGGMRLSKPRVPIDYIHDDGDIIGYANKFDTDSGDLVVSGALTPFKESDRATEIVFKAKQGVPYEASINFSAPVKLQELAAGETTEVNGRNFTGPGVVIREWTLRGIAVCPYGADRNTSTTFKDGGATVAVEFLGEPDMATDTKTPSDVENQVQDEVTPAVAVDAEPDDDKAKVEDQAQDQETVEAEPVVAAELVDRAAEGKRFLEAFGDRGGRWFAEGKTFAEAQTLYIRDLESRVEELSKRFGTSNFGEVEPVAASRGEAQPKEKAIRISGRV